MHISGLYSIADTTDLRDKCLSMRTVVIFINKMDFA